MSLTRSAIRRPYVCRNCTLALRRRHRLHTTARPSIYDVVCVGGGPVGLGLIAALKSSPHTSALSIALLESQSLGPSSSWSPTPSIFSNRASSLTPTTRRFLQRIGAWQHLDTSRIQPFERMAVWDGVSGARIDFEWEGRSKYEEGQGTVAYMVENANLVRALLRRLSELGGIDVHDGTRVEGIGFGTRGAADEEDSGVSSADESGAPPAWDLSSWPHLNLSSGSTLAARLLVGADGFNSPVRRFAGIESRGWDYDRHGVVATLRLSHPPAGPVTAYQRFLPTGPVALLPLPDGHASLVWSTTPKHAAHLKTLAPEDFTATVNAAFRLSPVDLAYLHTIPSGQVSEVQWRLQHTPSLAESLEIPGVVETVQEGSVVSFPLRLRHADTYATHRVALAGDAAHSMHPLAGQGLNTGMGDVEALAAAAEFAVTHGMDVGDQLSLEGYNAARYDGNNRLMGVVDKLHKLYTAGSGPLVGVRSLGLEAVKRVPGLKEFFMRQAAG